MEEIIEGIRSDIMNDTYCEDNVLLKWVWHFQEEMYINARGTEENIRFTWRNVDGNIIVKYVIQK